MRAKQQDFKLYDGLAYWVVRFGRLMQQDLAARLAEHDLNDRKLGVLMSIETSHKETPSAIAAYMSIDRAVVARTLKELREQGLVQHYQDLSDGRSRRVVLTAEGRKVFKLGTECARAMNEAFAAKMPQGLAAQVRQTFRQIATASGDEAESAVAVVQNTQVPGPRSNAVRN